MQGLPLVIFPITKFLSLQEYKFAGISETQGPPLVQKPKVCPWYKNPRSILGTHSYKKPRHALGKLTPWELQQV